MRRLAIVAVAIATAFALMLPADTVSAARPIGAANAKALAALQNAKPVLEGVTTLADFTGLKGRFLTHAGPPIDYAHMSGAQQGATWAAILFEGWASDLDGAKRLAPHIRLVTNHELHGVGGMAGVISPSMLVYVTRDATSGKQAYSIHEYESFFGLFDAPTIEQLRFWNSVVMPTIGRALKALHGVELNPIMAEALLRGDEMHCLTTSATNALVGVLAPAIVENSNDADAAATLKELAAFPHLAMLGIGMGASKAASMAAEGFKGSSVVTVMARNGTTEGIQVSGLPGRWFTVPAAEIDLVPFPGNENIKPGRDLGDSAVQEVWGFGAGSAAAAAYSGLAAEVGLTSQQMIATSRRQAKISLGTKTGFPILQLGGPPGLGLDAHLVVAKHLPPRILTAAAAAEPGHPILGLGVSEMPVPAFRKALAVL
jgi:Protein of unknown function (DUF1116)